MANRGVAVLWVMRLRREEGTGLEPGQARGIFFKGCKGWQAAKIAV
jgi:hypothetical protein